MPRNVSDLRVARRLLNVIAMKRLCAVCLVAACGASSMSGDDDAGPGTSGDPPVQAGPYQVETRVDLTIEAILPDQAELVVSTLREFSTNPAHALIDLADKAGVPAIGTLYSVLPGPLKDHLEGWFNDEIAKVKIGGQPITIYAGDVASLADTELSQFAVDSELTIDVDNGTATHTLTALDLSPTGIDEKLPIGGLAGDILTQTPNVVVAEGGAVSFDDQHFGLEYGQYAWDGLEAISQAEFGGDIRTVIGNAVNCPNVAHAVANQCLLGVCVGHESELTSICNGGLDAVVSFAHDQMVALRFDLLHYASGSGQLVDDDGDGVADRITGGTWDAELNLGMGLRHAPATFTATR